MATYTWRPGMRARIPAQIWGDFMEQTGMRTAEEAVELAAPSDSPIHDAFTWDDAECGQRYRLWQARHCFGSIQVVGVDIESDDREDVVVEAEVSFARHHVPGVGYVPKEELLEHEDWLEASKQECLAKIRGLQKRYREIKALKPIWDAVSLVTQET